MWPHGQRQTFQDGFSFGGIPVRGKTAPALGSRGHTQRTPEALRLLLTSVVWLSFDQAATPWESRFTFYSSRVDVQQIPQHRGS